MTDVIGAIRDKWLRLGGEGGFGAPLDIERPTFDGGGRAQPFNGGGFISWHPSIGAAFAVYGAIAQKWVSLGRERYGYPVTDEYACLDGGRANRFQTANESRDQAWIFWSPNTGAHEVHGLIGLVYDDEKIQNRLGYPTSDEEDIPGGRRNRFQKGSIDWNASTGEASVHGNLDDDVVQNPITD